MTEVALHKLDASALIGRIPLAGTKGTFAIALEEAENGVGFRFGFLTGQNEDRLLPCHATGTRQTPLEFIALLQAAIDSLEAQARAAG